MNDLKVFIFY